MFVHFETTTKEIESLDDLETILKNSPELKIQSLYSSFRTLYKVINDPFLLTDYHVMATYRDHQNFRRRGCT